jgi:hypothetical protein
MNVMLSLQFRHPGPPFPTLLRPAPKTAPKRPYSCYPRNGLTAVSQVASHRAGGLPPTSILLNTQRHTAKLFQFKGNLIFLVILIIILIFNDVCLTLELISSKNHKCGPILEASGEDGGRG